MDVNENFIKRFFGFLKEEVLNTAKELDKIYSHADR